MIKMYQSDKQLIKKTCQVLITGLKRKLLLII